MEKHGRNHVEIVFNSVLKLKEVMSCFYASDFKEVDKKVAELSKLEHDADDVRRKMELEFYNGAFLPFD